MTFQELTSKVLPLAKRIEKANNTMQKNAELCKLHGGFAAPSSLALNAAKLIILKGIKLSFEY